MPDGMITVVIADDHLVVRAGLRALIASAPDMQLIGEATNGLELVALVERVRPDVVVTDLSMGEHDGLTATRQILERMPMTRVLVLTMHSEDEYLVNALQAGACGYLLKSSADRDLHDAIRAVAAGDTYVQPAVSRALVRRLSKADTATTERNLLESLTPREREVLVRVAEGHSGPAIGRMLGISAKTVDTYRQRIAEKAGMVHRPDYVRFALRLGLLSADTVATVRSA